DNRSWLAKATLGLIESDAPLPPGETRASQDVIKQYEDAQEQIPDELQPEYQNEAKEQAQEEQQEAEGSNDDRSWFSYMTFGVFD
ncbi:MAG: outer membrane protein assembly factor BamD, partial [Pseudomonas sp.]